MLAKVTIPACATSAAPPLAWTLTVASCSPPHAPTHPSCHALTPSHPCVQTRYTSLIPHLLAQWSSFACYPLSPSFAPAPNFPAHSLPIPVAWVKLCSQLCAASPNDSTFPVPLLLLPQTPPIAHFPLLAPHPHDAYLQSQTHAQQPCLLHLLLELVHPQVMACGPCLHLHHLTCTAPSSLGSMQLDDELDMLIIHMCTTQVEGPSMGSSKDGSHGVVPAWPQWNGPSGLQHDMGKHGDLVDSLCWMTAITS